MRFSALAALALVALVPAAEAGPTPLLTHPPTIEQATLANGLRIAVVHEDLAPVVSVQVWYHVGSKDEPRNRRGAARMFEYLMFQGSEHVRPNAHAELIGSRGGYVSARVDEDSSHFSDTVPVEDLELAIKLEADRMRGLKIRKETVDATRAAYVEQLRREETQPITRGMLHLLSISFTRHPYGWTPGGVASDLEATTTDDLQKLYDTYYQPNNAMLVVVGKTSLESVKASADKYFGKIPKAADPPRPAEAEPEQAGSRREVIEPGPVGLALMSWHVPEAKSADFYPLQLAALMLGVGDNARIKQRIRKVGTEAGIDLRIHEAPSVLVLVGAFREVKQADGVEAAMLDEVKKLAKEGPGDAELRKAKNQVESGFVFSLERSDGLGEVVGRSWILNGEPAAFLRDPDMFEKVTADDIKRVAKTYLQPDHATIVVVPPKGQ